MGPCEEWTQWGGCRFRRKKLASRFIENGEVSGKLVKVGNSLHGFSENMEEHLPLLARVGGAVGNKEIGRAA